MGDIELVMVEQKGRVDARVMPPATDKAPNTPPTKPTPAGSKAVVAPPVQAGKMPPPVKADVATLPGAVSPPPGAKPLTFDLSGTDSDTNAIASGDHVIPAEPDRRFRNRAPVYPEVAAMQNQHGMVVLLIHVSEAGLTVGVDVVRTSGVPSLDDAAVNAVRSWHFRPALRDGRAVPFDMPFRFVFQDE